MYLCPHLKVCVFLLLYSVLSHGDKQCKKLQKLYGTVCVCDSKYCDTISSPKKLHTGKFHLYTTSKEKPGFNHDTGYFRTHPLSHGFKIEINSKKSYQKVRGFGGAFTDSFGYNLNSLPKKARENLIKSYFSENGIEYTTCRVVLGSCDFSLREYSYAPKYDPKLKSFSLTRDDHLYKIPHMKNAVKVSPNKIHFLGSSWNSPAWMRMTNASKITYIKPEFLKAWGDYHVKSLEEFKKEGLNFWGITTGNEPITLFTFRQLLKQMAGVVMFPEEQRDWILNHLGPALREHGLNTSIYLLDDMRYLGNWFMNVVMNNPRSKEYVAGVGLHWYMDSIFSADMFKEIIKKYPEQEIIYTESSFNGAFNKKTSEINILKNIDYKQAGASNKPFIGDWGRAGRYAADIIENLNHWVTTYIDWNLGLDVEGGPNRIGFPCDAAVLVDSKLKQFYKQPMFYVLGHFSKFISPESVIIETTRKHDKQLASDSRTYENVTFVGAKSPSGRMSVVVYNSESVPVEVAVHDRNRGYAILNLEANSISTLIYW